MSVQLLDQAVVRSEDPAILTAIAEPDVELAVWERRVPVAIDADTLDQEAFDDDFALDTLARELPGALAGVGHDPLIAAELMPLIRRFAGIMGCDAVRVRVEVVRTDACKRFHVDYVRARLLMTLCGPATQWIDLRDGNEPTVHQLATGDVAMVKGRIWAEDGSIRHRSPPIAGTGIRRLVVAIDPATPGDGA